MRNALLLCIIAFCFFQNVNGQQTGSGVLQYLTVDQGLSHNEVTCILQDRSGFLWFGTRGGLNRYDGYELRVFKNELGNPNSLADNAIESLFEDSQGRIWIGTHSRGVSCYDPVLDRFKHYPHDVRNSNSISGNRIIAIAEGEPGEIWLGTWENGFTIFLEKENRFIRKLINNDVIRKVQGICQTQNGEMWIGANNGLYHFDLEGRELGRYTPENTNFNQYTQVLEDQLTGDLWLSAWRNGLYRFNRSAKTFKQYMPEPGISSSISFYHTYSLLQDEKNNIWVGTWGGGLNRYNHITDSFTRFDITPPQLGSKNRDYQYVLKLLQDDLGIIWIATEGGGIVKLDESKNQFGLIGSGQSKGLNNGHVVSIIEDQENGLWIGTKGGGLNYTKDRKSYKTIPLLEKGETLAQAPNRINWVTSLFEDHRGIIWAGTEYGLHKIQKKEDGIYELAAIHTRDDGARRPKLDNWAGAQVSTIYETSDSVLWVGMVQRGLNRVSTKEEANEQGIKHYRKNVTPGALKSNRISTILEDSRGRVWVGTNGGLHLYRPETDDFSHFKQIRGDLQSLSSEIITCLREDRQGRLWVGTPNGLNLAQENPKGEWIFSCLQEQDGLPNSYINAILEDDQSNLWISTNGGISKFNPVKKVFYNYDISNGLQANAFSPGAAFRSVDSTLYFGGLYGINYFKPETIRNNPQEPKVVLTGLKIFNNEIKVLEKLHKNIILEKAITHTKSIRLTHRQNVFSIDFSALDFHAPNKNLYSYKLEGFDEEWAPPSSQRTAPYTNLEAGNYTFRVKAANNSHVWNEEGASLEIKILPPFWATPLAYTIYTLAFMGLLLAFRNISIRQSRLTNNLKISQMERAKDQEIAELKSRFFTNITHELRTPLTLISGPVEQLLGGRVNSNEKAKEFLLLIHHNTQRLLGLVNRLLDFRKAETGHMQLEVAEGNFVRFAKEVFLSFQEMARKNEIEYVFSAQENYIPIYYDRDKMEIVLCNLLTNAFKYSPLGSRIELSLEIFTQASGNMPVVMANGYSEIIVKDNGKGMSVDFLEKIFDRFYQVAQTDSVQMIGTGIGLALVKNIVDLHHGVIEVSSELGQGSVFLIRLPLGGGHFQPREIIPEFKNSEDASHYRLNLAREELAASLAVSDSQKNGETRLEMLIAEDNPDIRSFVYRLFEDRFAILEAKDGWQALEMALENIPDIIISDIMMPELDGLSLCARLKEDERTSHIPVLLLTARTETVFKVEGFTSGADAYVTKPFNPEVLKAQVDNLLKIRQKLKDYYSKKITLEPSDIEITSLDEQFLKRIIQVVADNLQNSDFNTQTLAQEVAMSQSTLYRKIKALTGESANTFIRDVRLKRAAQLLQESQLNVSEIAYQVGFGDVKYFRKCFRKRFDKTPTEYVKAQGEKGEWDKMLG